MGATPSVVWGFFWPHYFPGGELTWQSYPAVEVLPHRRPSCLSTGAAKDHGSLIPQEQEPVPQGLSQGASPPAVSFCSPTDPAHPDGGVDATAPAPYPAAYLCLPNGLTQ